MTFPEAPSHMYELRNQTVNKFGYDQITGTSYKFNSLGYRSDIEFTPVDNAVILLGNTITFGLGVELDKTFAGQLCASLSVPVYNFSWGCYSHTNHEQLELLQNILAISKPKCVIFQINNLNRSRSRSGIVNFNNDTDFIKSEYVRFYQSATTILADTPHIFLHWDHEYYGFEFSDCLVYNKYHVDQSVPDNNSTFGPKSHKLIALKLLQQLK